MTDKELLERAAKAAGLKGTWTTTIGYRPCLMQESGHLWRPLQDDGDALRLAVKLGIEVVPLIDAKMTRAAWLGDVRQIEEPHGADPYAATRRAIVRAAAVNANKQ